MVNLGTSHTAAEMFRLYWKNGKVLFWSEHCQKFWDPNSVQLVNNFIEVSGSVVRVVQQQKPVEDPKKSFITPEPRRNYFGLNNYPGTNLLYTE